MPYGITQCYLPPGRGDIPALTPAEAGTRLSDPGGMQGWVDPQMCPERGNVPTLGRPPAKQPCNARRETVGLSKCPFVCRSASLPAFLGRRQVACFADIRSRRSVRDDGRIRCCHTRSCLINQSINFYLLKMSRDTHKRLFNCEQDNRAETSTNSCPTNKLNYERKEKLNA